jgi:hypothetical protein
MNAEDLEWIRWNFKSEQGQEDDSREISAQKGLMMAVKDPKTWLFMAIHGYTLLGKCSSP